MRKVKELVTIVIVTYNSSNYIKKLIDSIENTKTSNFFLEILVIENNSPDHVLTSEIVEKKSKKSKLKISFIMNKQNIGFGKACNKGASLAKGKYLLFLNPDTYLHKDSIDILYNHYLKNKADIIGGKCIREDGYIHRTVVRFPNLTTLLFEFSNLGKILKSKNGTKYFYYEDIKNLYSSNNLDYPVDAVSGAYLFMKKSVFFSLKGFDENFFMYLEDVDLGIRAQQAGYKVMFCPHSIISHKGGGSSLNKYKIRHDAWFNSRKYFVKKHYNLFVNIIIQPLYSIEAFLLKKFKSI